MVLRFLAYKDRVVMEIGNNVWRVETSWGIQTPKQKRNEAREAKKKEKIRLRENKGRVGTIAMWRDFFSCLHDTISHRLTCGAKLPPHIAPTRFPPHIRIYECRYSWWNGPGDVNDVPAEFYDRTSGRSNRVREIESVCYSIFSTRINFDLRAAGNVQS